MAETLPITPSVLKWARESMGFSITEVAKKLSRKETDITQWEEGKSAPTYNQLEQLANKYKRPLAIFFFSSPPKEDLIKHSFRTLPDSELNSIPPNIRYLLRKAKVYQLKLKELFQNSNPATNYILKDLNFTPDSNPEMMAQEVREYLDIDIEYQIDIIRKSKNSSDVLKYWRNLIENHGIFVFKDSFRPAGKRTYNEVENNYSGFCLYNDKLPIIFINNNGAKKRQIFTLLHELCHLLLHSSGIDKIDDNNYIEKLSGDNKYIEILCNKFAGEFLVPTNHFQSYINDNDISEGKIENLANKYSVSRDVILRKLYDLDLISQSDYSSRVQELKEEWNEIQKQQKKGGGDFYTTHLTYLSKCYVDRVFDQIKNGNITNLEAANFLRTDIRKLEKFEQLSYEFWGE